MPGDSGGYEEVGGDHIVFLTVEDVVEIHREAIAHYSPGESFTILNPGLLESAVLTPQQSFGGQYVYPTIADMAAAYMAGLARSKNSGTSGSSARGNREIPWATPSAKSTRTCGNPLE